MHKYTFWYKRWFFWKKQVIVGHKLEGNTMNLYFEDGSIMTIPSWDKHALKLKQDWVLAVKRNAEAQAGVDFKTNIK